MDVSKPHYSLSGSDYQLLFEALPTLHLIVDPDFTIITASDDYIEATLTKREDIIGRNIFDVFPDNPDDLETGSTRSLRTSFENVLKTRTAQTMPLQKYDIPLPEGGFEERYWSVINQPVMDSEHNIKYIAHRVEDVTEFVKLRMENSGSSKLSTKNIKPSTETFITRNLNLICMFVVTVVTALIVLMFMQQSKLTAETRNWVLHTYTVNSHIQNLLGDMRDAAYSQRAFVVSGDEKFLKRYFDAFGVKGDNTGSVNSEMQTLRDMTRDNPVQQKYLNALDEQEKTLLKNIKNNITIRRMNGDRTPADLNIDIFNEFMTDIRGNINAMMEEESRLLTQRSQDDIYNTHRNITFTTASMALFYIGLILALQLVARHWRNSRRMESEVYLRSVEIAKMNSELQDKNSELENLNAKIEKHGLTRLSAVVDNSLDGIITLSDKGLIQIFNPACERYFGYDESEVLGKSIKFLIPDPYAGELNSDQLPDYLNTGDIENLGSVGREVIARRKDDSEFPIDLSISTFTIDNVKYFSGIIRDITARKSAEKRVQNYTKALERSNQELDDFAYIASHDLKEPLRGIFNHATFLLEDYADTLGDDGKKRLTRLTYLSKRMEHLVNDLMYFSRLGRTELAVQDTDPVVIIEEIKQMIDSLPKEKPVNINIIKPMPHILCDRPRMTEVFRNLITNAMKYNDKPEVNIEIGYLDRVKRGVIWEHNVFYVKDNGIGIRPEFHEEVFRIFKRVGKVKDESTEGTGVGLTFVKKIIENHDGSIWLDSDFGKNTIFYFTIKKGAEKWQQNQY